MDAEWIVSLVLQKFQSFLLDQATIISCSKLRAQVQKATNKLNSLNQLLKEARNEQQMEREGALLVAVYSAEDAIDVFLTRTTRSSGLANLWSQFVFTLKIKKFMVQIHSVVGNDNSFSGSGLQAANNQQQQLQGLICEGKDIVGGEDQVRELVALLIAENGSNQGATKVISVVGESGSGKTALARIVYEGVRIKQFFKNRAWVSVSNDVVKVRDLVFEMLKQVDQMVAEAEEPFLEQDLVSRLSRVLQDCKYLIVVDGVGSLEVWDRLRNVFPNSDNGSRIVVTTCSADVAAVTSSTLCISRLNNEESWELFLKKVRITESILSSNSNLISFKEKILNLCDGLPLAIILMGSLLSIREYSHSEWSRVIELANILGRDIVTLSYIELPSCIKPCFLHMSLFPRAFEVPVRRLVQLWIAERLVIPTCSGELALEDVANLYLQELINRNMIEVAKWKSNGIPKTCRMPISIHDVFSRRAENIGLFYIHCKSHYAFEYQPPYAVRRLVSYVSMKNYPASDYYIQHLRSYISFTTHRGGMPALEIDKFLNKIIRRSDLRLLILLDLEGVYKPRLPTTIGKLVNLRYVGLRSTVLDSLPESVCYIPSLETLDVKHTMITALPSSIWMSKNLRHLYMDWINFDDMSFQMPPNSEPLSKLQTVWGLSISEGSPVLNILNKLTCLRKLGLRFSSTQQEPITNWISQLTNLQSLRLRSVKRSGERGSIRMRDFANHLKLQDLYLLGVLPRPIDSKHLPPNLKILTLSMSQLRKDPMQMLGKLPQLNILRLFANSYTGEEMTCHNGGFPQLHVLKVWKLLELKEWTVKEGTMPCLRELEIRECKRLVRLHGLRQVASLKELVLTNMPSHFVQDVKECLNGTDVFIQENEWKPCPLLA